MRSEDERVLESEPNEGGEKEKKGKTEKVYGLHHRGYEGKGTVRGWCAGRQRPFATRDKLKIKNNEQ